MEIAKLLTASDLHNEGSGGVILAAASLDGSTLKASLHQTFRSRDWPLLKPAGTPSKLPVPVALP
jgi:hypothetical protein